MKIGQSHNECFKIKYVLSTTFLRKLRLNSFKFIRKYNMCLYNIICVNKILLDINQIKGQGCRGNNAIR